MALPTASTSTRAPAGPSGSGLSGQIREAKGLALELKSLLKRKEPWDRDLEFQRESTRKAYLRIIFSPSPSPTSTSPTLARASRTSSAADLSLKPRSSSSAALTPAALYTSRILDTLNLLWLDTSHSLIQSYRARLADLDKQLALEKEKSKRGRPSAQQGGGGAIQPVGPVARRKLVHSFRQFLAKETEFWKTLCGRFAARLEDEERVELRRAVGIVASFIDDTADANAGDAEAQKSRRSAVLPLAHKALICLGDLERYNELYNESSSVPTAAATSGRGGKRGGKAGVGSGERKIKTYAKAAECYNQARLLLPDNGNPSNQLAVLSQYASDPLASIYHYYRAICVRSMPFSTARANLQITFKKAVARWVENGPGEGDEAERFKTLFVALQGVFFTKERLPDIQRLTTETTDLFRIVIAERLFTSDVVLKIVVTSLAALWDARMSRTGPTALSRNGTKNGSKALLDPAAGDEDGKDASTTSPKVNLEPHILVHLFSLFTALLSVSTAETLELVSANQTSPDAPSPHASQNISAVLRRALPSIRILNRWLVAQVEYVGRVEARVEASERRRARTSTSTTGAGGIEEAQNPSLDSSGANSTPSGTNPLQRVSLAEFRTALDDFWTAYADFSNTLKLAFPPSELPPLDDGAWLEEDVELLGFAAVKFRAGASGADSSAKEIRRVGRDVHPNDEQLMRVAESQRDAARLADSDASRIEVVDGAFVFVPQAQELVVDAADDVEDDEEMADVEEATEDDPVDRAMRVVAAAEDGLSDLDDEDDDDEAEEQVVYPGNRSGSLPPTNFSSPNLSRSSSHYGSPAAPPRTAADLRQQLFASAAPIDPLSRPDLRPSRSTSAALPAPPHASTSLASGAGPSIWAPATGHPAASLLPASSPSSAQFSSPHAQLVTAHSFEAIPNLTHGSPAAKQAGWSTLPPASAGPPGLAGLAGAGLYGGAFAAPPLPRAHTGPPGPAHHSPSASGFVASPPHAHPHTPLSTAFAGLAPHHHAAFAPIPGQGQTQNPFAPGFVSGGWPAPNSGGGGRGNG
ncbi:hypothetical protein RTG_00618 [Rhodotorula toruloides ATCC 204091]|uniref:Protein SMG7 n=1 Tax=Rhodotorula toruloides TaxID=5286 RepID=A0A2T0A0E0_RHOTO|nr:hypothetical protein RTG_00618 [Rhodotorula toruloides ATCC 204091]KAK4335395.1 hypothetical protein RTBOTA2_004155 [Rhodotorula toruloides]PRQ71488.1 hypothetical protein AAT19DRAFT_10346 [Rhodotorula toruloides]